MNYTNFEPLRAKINLLAEYAALQTEYGCSKDVAAITEKLNNFLVNMEKELCAVSPDPALSLLEPDDYQSILALCDGGNQRKPVNDLENRMAGAVLGRFAGCTLGVPVELWDVQRMKDLAKFCNMEFPPRSYWKEVDRPWDLQYQMDPRWKYKNGGIDGVPVDDDITYTILGLLLIEKYGFDFTTADVGEYWKENLPYACTAEQVALENLRAGVPIDRVAEINNPYCQWIGADIRSDGFAFAAAGNPRLAASMGYRDAYLSHRRNGIYGEMFFAAAESAAFLVNDPVDAIRMALLEIPRECTLHKDIEWALQTGSSIKNYEEARQAVDERFAGMSYVHTCNNACLTVFGLMLGKGDFTETISNVVAMGLDNDCTGATAGSIVGAVTGKNKIPEFWIRDFNNKVRTYIKGQSELLIDDVISRFITLAKNQPEINY